MDPDQTDLIWFYTVCQSDYKGGKDLCCNGQNFHEMHSRLRSSNNLLTLNQIDRT